MDLDLTVNLTPTRAVQISTGIANDPVQIPYLTNGSGQLSRRKRLTRP